jgi:hydroxymethylglutaryl-CoA reductase (NADPH)
MAIRGIGFGAMSGAIGMRGHFANALVALYVASGQDALAESAIGLTRLEVTDSGDRYAAATLPHPQVDTARGGTSLPSRRACLERIGLSGEGHARAGRPKPGARSQGVR